MASEAQIAANRANARASTGPRSEEGKARVAQNGLKHGLCSTRVLLPGEDAAAFEALVADLKACFRPANEAELALLHEYAAASWRLDRIPALEAGLLEGAWPEGEAPADLHPDAWGLGEAFLARSKEILRLSLHESRLSRQRERARKELQALQAARKQAAAELALDSQTAETPAPALAVGEREERRMPQTQPPSPARRPEPHPNPLPQGREQEQNQSLAPESALLSRKAA